MITGSSVPVDNIWIRATSQAHCSIVVYSLSWQSQSRLAHPNLVLLVLVSTPAGFIYVLYFNASGGRVVSERRRALVMEQVYTRFGKWKWREYQGDWGSIDLSVARGQSAAGQWPINAAIALGGSLGALYDSADLHAHRPISPTAQIKNYLSDLTLHSPRGNGRI